MINDNSKTRAEILRELESIQGLLLEDDVPLLREVFDDQPAAAVPSALKSASKVETARDPSYPGRPTKANGENPFLPQHIRERLHGNNPMPHFELELSPNPRSLLSALSPAQPAPLEPTVPPPEPAKPPETATDKPVQESRQALIKSVIEALQPDIERELNQALEQLSSDALLQLLTESD